MEPTLRHTVAKHGLNTAILVTGRLLETESGPHELGPLSWVGGLSLFHRTVLTLQRAGIEQFFVLGGEEEDALRRALVNDPRVTAKVRWMPIREFPLDDPRTWEVLGGEIHQACLIMGVRAVFAREVIQLLRNEIRDGTCTVVATAPSRSPAEPELIVLPGTLLRDFDWSTAVRGANPLRLMIDHLQTAGRVKTLSLQAMPAPWYLPVRCPEDVMPAEDLLLRSTKTIYEGWIDRYFNRKVSVALTRFFLRAGWSPNAVTMLSLFVGLVAAGCFAYGTYLAGLLGALFFQFAAILDCCDGDVARVTLGESPFGAFLDLWGDNVVHMAIFAGIAWAGSQHGWTLAPAAGAAAIVGNALSLWFVSRLTRQRDQRVQKTPARAAWSEFILRNVASRDFSVFLLIFALLNALQWFLYLAAVGSNVFWMIAAWVARPPWNRA